METTILLFYKYVKIEDTKDFADAFRTQAEKLELTGRALIAEEGINATLEGNPENAEAFAAWILQNKKLSDMQIKRSEGTGEAFPKLSVKVREEIVGTRFPKEVDPTKETGTYLSAEELREWYEKGEDFVVIDMRNSYEYQSGHFKDSIDMGLRNSRDLPHALDKLKKYKGKKKITVCTGGIRCEKMSALLLHEGFDNVYQLEGGIHTYMEKYPGKDFLGTLYTFDNRDTMHFGGERVVVGRCAVCEKETEAYTNCMYPTCNAHFMACETCAPKDRSIPCKDCQQKVKQGH